MHFGCATLSVSVVGLLYNSKLYKLGLLIFFPGDNGFLYVHFIPHSEVSFDLWWWSYRMFWIDGTGQTTVKKESWRSLAREDDINLGSSSLARDEDINPGSWSLARKEDINPGSWSLAREENINPGSWAILLSCLNALMDLTQIQNAKLLHGFWKM